MRSPDFAPAISDKSSKTPLFTTSAAGGFRVRVGQIDGREIDFVAEKDGGTSYYQVAYLLPDPATVEREFGNLAKIPNDYPKFVVSMDPMAGGQRNGIRHLPLRQFLMDSIPD